MSELSPNVYIIFHTRNTKFVRTNQDAIGKNLQARYDNIDSEIISSICKCLHRLEGKYADTTALLVPGFCT